MEMKVRVDSGLVCYQWEGRQWVSKPSVGRWKEDNELMCYKWEGGWNSVVSVGRKKERRRDYESMCYRSEDRRKMLT